MRRISRRTLARLAVLCVSVVWAPAAIRADSETLPPVPLLARLKGKVVLLDFWASWCAPCRKSFPWMNELQSRYGRDGLAIVAVNLDKDRHQAEKFLRDTPAEFRIEYDVDGAMANALHVAAMPTSFLIDRHGRVVEQHAGFREAQRADREAEITQLLKASAP